MTVTTTADLRAAAQLRRQAADAERHARGDIAYQALRSAPPIGPGRRGRPIKHELRAKPEVRGSKELVHTSGYFTRYNHYYPMWDAFGGYREQVCRGAGAWTLARNPEVAFLTNHAGMAMARTTSGTLELREDAQGGWHDGWLNPKRSDVSDLVIAINDGDVPQMSFAFTIPDGGGMWSEDFESFDIVRFDMEGGDVSAVNFGANPTTDISARLAEVLDDIAYLPDGAAEEAANRLVLRGATTRERIHVRHVVVPQQRGPRPAPGAYPARLAGRLDRTADRFEAHFGRAAGPASAIIQDIRNTKLPWYEIRNADGDADAAAPEDDGVATVLIYDEIGGSFGVNAKSFETELSEITAPQIKVRINSPGGSVFDGLAIGSAIMHHDASVRVFIDGLAASAASFIAMAASPPDGDWGGIHFMPGSQMMIHDASAQVDGNADDMGRWQTFLARQSDNIADMYAAVAGGTREEWRELMIAETWYLADEAVEAGLGDMVVPHPRQAATEERMRRSFDLSRFGYRFMDRSAAGAPRRRSAVGQRWQTRTPFAVGGRIPERDDLTPVRLADGEVDVNQDARERFGKTLDYLNDAPAVPATPSAATPERPKGRSIASIELWLQQQKLE